MDPPYRKVASTPPGNERAEMKESRQNYREIRVQNDNITEIQAQDLINSLKFTVSFEAKKARETFCILAFEELCHYPKLFSIYS